MIDIEMLKVQVYFGLKNNSLSAENWEAIICESMGATWVAGDKYLADGVFDRYPFSNDAPQADQAIFNGRTFANLAAISNQAFFDIGSIQLSWRQEARTGIDMSVGFHQLEGRIAGTEAQIGFVKCLDGSDVFPVIVEQVNAHFFRSHRSRKNFLSKIQIVRFLHQVEQDVSIENINPHAGDQIASLARNAPLVDPFGLHADMIHFWVRLRLF